MSESLDGGSDVILQFPVSAKMREMLDDPSIRALMGELVREAYDQSLRFREYEAAAKAAHGE